MLKMNFSSYDNGKEIIGLEAETVKKIEQVSFSYDGGRLTININGKTLYHTLEAGNDCEVNITID